MTMRTTHLVVSSLRVITIWEVMQLTHVHMGGTVQIMIKNIIYVNLVCLVDQTKIKEKIYG